MPSLSFSASGHSIIEHLRGLMRRGDWRKAYQDIKEIFPEVAEEPLIDILNGVKILTGRTTDPDGLNYIDDEDTSYREWLAETYEGSTLIDGTMYRPVSIVSEYGINDQRDDSSLPDYVSLEDQASLSNFERCELLNRALFYANANRMAKAILCEVPVSRDTPNRQTLAVIFEPSFDLPGWIKPAPSTQEAVERRLAKIEYTGHDKLFSKNMSRTLPSEADRIDAILKQNQELGYGLREIDFGGIIGVRQVPMAPLIVWAAGHLRRYQKVEASIPHWKPVNPSGLKLTGDDPTHSDWMMASGLWDTRLWGEELDRQMWNVSEDLQMELTGTVFHVLAAGKPSASGIIKFCSSADDVDHNTIAVVPNASVKYYEIALKAAATIVTEGGAMSHLAVNGLADNLLIVRVASSKASFKDGDQVTLDIEKGLAFKNLADLEPVVSLTP